MSDATKPLLEKTGVEPKDGVTRWHLSIKIARSIIVVQGVGAVADAALPSTIGT